MIACSDPAPVDAPQPDAAPALCPALETYRLLPFSCGEMPERCPEYHATVDDDGDGAGEAQGDCDDRTIFVGPGAAEVCDLRDNDCDGQVDEGGVCPDPSTACPLSFADVRCCGAEHTIAGSFYELVSADLPTAYSPGNGFADPFVVMLRRRDTGELRAATTCAAPPETTYGYPFRYHLRDVDFVQPGADYEVVIHLRWYMPWTADPASDCYFRVPVVTTSADTASTCMDYGPIILGCL